MAVPSTPVVTETPARFAPDEAMIIACPPFSGHGSLMDTAEGSDLMLLRLTQMPLLSRTADGRVPETADGTGAAGLRVISRSDGSTVLRIKMREDICYSDGSYADADDLIFILYVLLDPDYTGGLRLRDCDIVGLKAYRTETDPELLAELEKLYAEASAGEGALAGTATDCLRKAWDRSLEILTQRCRTAFLGTYAPYAMNCGAEAAEEDEGALRAFTLWCAGLAEAADNGGNMKDRQGNLWNPAAGIVPDAETLYALFSEAFGSVSEFDAVFGLETERWAEETFIRRLSGINPSNTVPSSISGIVRVDDYTVELQLSSFSEDDVKELTRVWLLPLSVYGEVESYCPEEGSFGFERGTVDEVLDRTEKAGPGAGAFTLAESDDGRLYLEANLYYAGGIPKVGEIWFETVPETEIAVCVSEGRADLGFISGSPAALAEVRGLAGVAIRSVASEVCGVLRVNPDSFRTAIEEEPDGGGSGTGIDEAVLRIATACCRVSASEYFDGAATVPEDCETEETALEAVCGMLGGLTEEEERSYTALVYGEGKGDHPCWNGLLRASELLEELGISLQIVDASTEEEFWSIVDTGEADIWAAGERIGMLPKPDGFVSEDCRAIYQRLDLLILNSERFEMLSLPVELTWAKDHISVIESLELK